MSDLFKDPLFQLALIILCVLILVFYSNRKAFRSRGPSQPRKDFPRETTTPKRVGALERSHSFVSAPPKAPISIPPRLPKPAINLPQPTVRDEPPDLISIESSILEAATPRQIVPQEKRRVVIVPVQASLRVPTEIEPEDMIEFPDETMAQPLYPEVVEDANLTPIENAQRILRAASAQPLINIFGDTVHRPWPVPYWWPWVIDIIPHLLLVGETGSGKSTTARALLAGFSQKGRVVIGDPHGKFNDWGGLPVIGMGRNFAAMLSMFRSLDLEMSRRYLPGEEIGGRITIFCDEYPTFVEATPAASNHFLSIAREGRKPQMNGVFLAQEPTVEALGIKGNGPARRNFGKLLLGEYALQHFPNLQETYPAALEYKGKRTPISLGGLMTISQIPIPRSAIWNIPNITPNLPEITPAGRLQITHQSSSGPIIKLRLRPNTPEGDSDGADDNLS